MKIVMLVVESHSEGCVSQILYVGPSFCFMKSRKLSSKKWYKSFPFFDIKYEVGPR